MNSGLHPADPILAQAIAGSATVLDVPACGFTLSGQRGRVVSLDSVRGKRLFLTGPAGMLRQTWTHDVAAGYQPGVATVTPDDLTFVITRDGIIDVAITTDPGPGTPATASPSAVLLAGYVRQAPTGQAGR